MLRKVFILFLFTILCSGASAQHFLSFHIGYGNTLYFPDDQPRQVVTFPKTFSWGGSYLYNHVRHPGKIGGEFGVDFWSYGYKPVIHAGNGFSFHSPSYGYVSISTITNVVVPLHAAVPGFTLSLGPGLSYSPRIDESGIITVDTVPPGTPPSLAFTELNMVIHNNKEQVNILARASLNYQWQLKHVHYMRFQLGGQYFITRMARGAYELYSSQQYSSGALALRPKHLTLSVAYGL